MKKKIIALMAVTLVLGSLLGACSSKNNNPEPSNQNGKQTEASSPVSSEPESSDSSNSDNSEVNNTDDNSSANKDEPNESAAPESSDSANPTTSTIPELKPDNDNKDKDQGAAAKSPAPTLKPTPAPSKKPEASKQPTQPSKKPETSKHPEPTKKPTASKQPEPSKKPEPTKQPEPSKAPELSTHTIVANMLEQVQQPHLVELTSEQAKDFYGIDMSIVEDFSIRIPMINVKTNEVAVIKAKTASDVKAIKTGMEKRAKDVQKQFESYLPDQYENAKNYQIVTHGNYVLFVISESADELVKAFKGSF